MCGGSPSPALAQSPDDAPPPPTHTPTPPVPKYRDILVAYLTDPNERLGPVSATFSSSTAMKFRMAPARPDPKHGRKDWQLLYLDNKNFQYDEDGNMRWRCISPGSQSNLTGDEVDGAYTADRVYDYTFNPSYHSYLRGIVVADGDACESKNLYKKNGETVGRPNTSVAVLKDKWSVKTRIIYLSSGSPGPDGREPDVPPDFAHAPTLQTLDDLIYQAPGGHWTTQMLVSFGAAVVVMIVLRSMAGLMIGIMVMPLSAYGMYLIGYGSGWFVMVMALLFVFSVVAWGMVTRRA